LRPQHRLNILLLQVAAAVQLEAVVAAVALVGC
jgi:hypothetical protein